jgi:cellulose biosynthesis protein BcsQ
VVKKAELVRAALQNLAVYLQTKNRDVLLLDADPQGTTTDWIKERDENEDLKISHLYKLQAIFVKF